MCLRHSCISRHILEQALGLGVQPSMPDASEGNSLCGWGIYTIFLYEFGICNPTTATETVV